MHDGGNRFAGAAAGFAPMRNKMLKYAANAQALDRMKQMVASNQDTLALARKKIDQYASHMAKYNV